MDGFKNIEINNFRGIDHLKIDDFSRVNIFLGQNSSGKSSVLEAVNLSLNMSNPDMPQVINNIRARKSFTTFMDAKYLFHNLDMSIPPNLTLEQTDGAVRHLALGLTYVFDELAEPKNEPIQQAGSIVYVNTLEINFSTTVNGEKQDYKSWLRINPAGIVVNRKIADNYLERLRGRVISADLTSDNTLWDLAELFKRNQKNTVLSLLKLFDARINSIEILNDDVYLGFDGMAEMLPSRMTGDGLRRYLSIAASAANPMTHIIMLDEIDNGLHYSAYKKLWEALFILAVGTDKQLFVTTHSKETLQKLNQMLEEHPEFRNEMALYTLEQTKLKGHQAYRYPYEGLAEACKNNIEIRSVAL